MEVFGKECGRYYPREGGSTEWRARKGREYRRGNGREQE
jgi:hypothetical protein